MDPGQKLRRRAGLGGSDIAAIFGLSPFASPIDVYLDKTGRDTEPEPERDDAQKRRGNILEPAIANWYADEEGVRVVTLEPSELPLTGEVSWAMASPDRLVVQKGDTRNVWSILQGGLERGLEVKTARSMEGWGDAGTDVIPVEKYLQCVWYMYVLDVDRWDVAVYFPMYDTFRTYTILRDRSIEARVVDHATSWWRVHIVGDTPPTVDGSAAAGRWLLDQHRIPTKPEREATPEEIALAEQLKQVRTIRKAAQVNEALLANQLKATIGEAHGIHGSFGAIAWGPVKGASRVDVKLLAENHPDIYAACIKTGKPTRSFRPLFEDDEEEG